MIIGPPRPIHNNNDNDNNDNDNDNDNNDNRVNSIINSDDNDNNNRYSAITMIIIIHVSRPSATSWRRLRE